VLAGAWEFVPVPVVLDGRCAGGPFLFPGWPGTPAPEFGACAAPCPALDEAPPCDNAGEAIAAIISAAAASLSMRTSTPVESGRQGRRLGRWRHTVTTLRCADRSCGSDNASRRAGEPRDVVFSPSP
jgi:hypothetical protein